MEERSEILRSNRCEFSNSFQCLFSPAILNDFGFSQYVMMLDVDFWLCTDFRQRMLESTEIMERLKGGMAAFVVPAFEFHKQSDGVDPFTFPSTKAVCPSLVVVDHF